MLSKELQDILEERERQISKEGFTVERDNEYTGSELALAAATYAINSAFSDEGRKAGIMSLAYWPWSRNWWKPTSRYRDLVKAGALIVAELERLNRMEKQNDR